MHTYIIAIYHEGDNRLFEVEAPTAIEAAKQALINHCDEQYRDKRYIDWVIGLGDNYEDVQDGAAQSELIISTYYKV